MSRWTATAPVKMRRMGNSQGARIRARRESQAMSRQGLADRVDVSRQSVIKWEDSKEAVEISRANLRELAKALKCSEEYILHGGSLEGSRAPKGLDRELLLDCLAATETALEGRQVAPQRRAEIIEDAYDMWADSGSRPPKEVLLKYIRRLL